MLEAINPGIHCVKLVERIDRQELCRSYNSKIIYLVSGELTVTLEGGKEKHKLSPGALLYIPSGAEYKLKSKYLRAVFADFSLTFDPAAKFGTVLSEDFDSTEAKEAPPPFDKPRLLPDMEAQRDGFIEMAEQFIGGRGEYLSEISAKIKLILVKIAEALDADALPPSLALALDSYIRENIADEISGVEIGAIFGYHPYYVSNILKERRGMTVKQYVNDYRMKYAASLLAYSALDVGSIAAATGFKDQSYFAKAFKLAYGVSPKDYRNEYKNKLL